MVSISEKKLSQEEVWNSIAESWSEYRKAQKEEVLDFLKSNLKKDSKIIDLGCGSGRNFIKVKGGETARFYGLDFSEKMIKIAREHARKIGIYAELRKIEKENVPFPDNSFDLGIFSAVLHCIEGEKKRRKILEEFYRVLKKDSKAFLSVWGKKQARLKNKPKETLMPWTIGDKKYDRYTYIFDKKELEDLLKDVGFKIEKSWEEENINFILKK